MQMSCLLELSLPCSTFATFCGGRFRMAAPLYWSTSRITIWYAHWHPMLRHMAFVIRGSLQVGKKDASARVHNKFVTIESSLSDCPVLGSFPRLFRNYFQSFLLRVKGINQFNDQ